jgi:hypothetical protein
MINGEDPQVSTTYGLNITAITFLEPLIAYMPPTGLSNYVGQNIAKLQHNMNGFLLRFRV